MVLHITNVALSPDAKPNAKATLKVSTAGKADMVLCTLVEGKVMQTPMELLFPGGVDLTFSVDGPCSVHLCGWTQPFDDAEDDEFDDEEVDSEEEEADLEEKMMRRIAAKRRAAAMQGGGDDDDEDDEFDGDDADDFDDEDDDEDEDEEEEEEVNPPPKKQQQQPKKQEQQQQPKKQEQQQPKKQEQQQQPKKQEQQQAQTPKGDAKPQTPKADAQKAQTPKADAQKAQTPKADAQKAQTPKADTPKAAEPAQKKPKVDAESSVGKMVKHDNGLQWVDDSVGSGPIVSAGKKVMVKYTGKLPNGKIFDSNNNGGKPFAFTLGKGEVIKGWDLGLQGMKVGGKRRLVIPSPLGYGKGGSGPIPPNSVLMFDIEVVGIKG